MTQSIAVITGGSRGLGKSMALALAARGVDVIITYKSNEAEARRVVEDIEALGRRAVALHLDVGRSATFGAFAETIRAALARVWRREHFDFARHGDVRGPSRPARQLQLQLNMLARSTA